METRKLKKCPYCGEMIMATAKKCRYCGSWIQGDESHMMRCPSCGEMIDKTIVTCPYCGERVKNSQPQYNENLTSNDNSKDNYEIENIIADDSRDEQQDTIDTSELTSMENDEDKEFIEIKNYVHCDSIIINILCVIGLLGSLFSELDNVNILNMVSGTNLGSIVIPIYNKIPTIFFNLMDGIGFCGLMYLLKNALYRFGKPMNGLIWALIICYALASCISDSIDVENTFSLLLAFATILLMIIIGFKMKNGYNNDIKTLGIVFFACPIGLISIIILFSLLSASVGIPESSADAIDAVAELACTLVSYIALGKRVGCTLNFWN